MRKFGCLLLFLMAFVVWLLPFLGYFRTGNSGFRSGGYVWYTLKSPILVGKLTYGCGFASSPSGNTIFAFGNEPGIFRSTDSGKSWKHVDRGMKSCWIYCMVCDSNGVVYAGSGRGVYRSTNNGETWQLANNRLPTGSVEKITAGQTDRLCLAINKEIFQSVDKGNNWHSIRKPDHLNVTCLCINNRGMIYAGIHARGIHRSKDNGLHWQCVTPCLDGSRIKKIDAVAQTMACDSKGCIYSPIECYDARAPQGHWDNYAIQSDQSGSYWKTLDPGHDARDISVAVGPKDQTIIGTNHGLFILDDSGKHWNSTDPYNGSYFGAEGELRHSIMAILTGPGGRIYTINGLGNIAVGTPVKKQ